MEERELRDFICEVGRNIWERQMVAANDGNITAKLDDGTILCTPTGVSKGYLKPKMLTRMTVDGDVVEAAPSGHRPTSEVKMHLRMYRANPAIGGCVHAHPIYGTVFAIKGEPLVKKMMPESVIAMPEVPLAPYATPSTEGVADSTEPFAHSYSACLLEQHGAFSWGKTLMDAYLAMERLEYTAKMTLLARLIGGERELPEAEIAKLIGMRAQYGL
ncbi:class II aldolase/adducin family protein [Trueperella sp.]|uniref:class II aldolase/adducin family protein n=1 Tax=Trueperella sp. TaxID=2699835 RepID=UPI0026049775|nr:class II aldolase/adducin family protein [Trueperella sp.]